MVELQPGVVVGKHTHPGEEISVVLEGELVLQMAGKPDVIVKAGQPFFIPSGVVHGVKANGATKLLATYVVEKGKPLRTAAQ
jgi:quercetin dioxygenase-like cupin family protein